MTCSLYFDADYKTRSIADGIEPLGFRIDIEDIEKIAKNSEALEKEPHTLAQVFEKKAELNNLI